MTIVYSASTETLTWEGARTAVRADLWRTGSNGIPDDVVDRALHAALRRLESERRWHWLEKINATLTQGTAGATLPAPSDIGSVNALSHYRGTTQFNLLTRAPLQHVIEAASGAASGYPSAYAVNGALIYLDCPVAVGATFHLIYKGRTSDSIDAVRTTPPLILSTRRNPVLALACWDIALGYLRDEQQAARHQARYLSMLETLANEDDEFSGDEFSGGIIPDTSYRAAAMGLFDG